MAKSVKLQEVAIDLLKPYGQNAKIHPQEQVEKIIKSIEEFGFITPCVIDADYNIIAGHGRVMAAKEMGLDTVPCVFIEGLSEEQRKAYILADNRLGELGEWDMDIVSEELETLKDAGFDIDLTGFDIDDIIIEDDMGADVDESFFEQYEETPPMVQPGEVWILDKHRLMCGDSTKIEDVKKLMDGEEADLLLTDPPYNVNYSQKNEKLVEAGLYTNAKTIATATKPIANDNMSDAEFLHFLTDAFQCAYYAMKCGASFYIFHSELYGGEFRGAIKSTAGMNLHQTLIWVKHSLVMGHSDYQWIHEPILYGWKEGSPHYFIDMRSLTTVQGNDTDELSREKAIELLHTFLEQTTIQEEKRPNINDVHPTMKPVPLLKKFIRNSRREGDIVLDLFGGSGSTLIASEEMNRRCYMMEYDPHYCDVIINRWEEQTGMEAYREQ